MAEPTLELIMAMLQKVLADTAALREDMQLVKQRLTAIDIGIAGLHSDYAGQSLRIDRLESRLDRIDVRLGLTDA